MTGEGSLMFLKYYPLWSALFIAACWLALDLCRSGFPHLENDWTSLLLPKSAMISQ